MESEEFYGTARRLSKGHGSLLGEEYPAYLASLEQPPRRAAAQPLKCSQPQLEAELPFALEPTPFSPLSFSFEAGEEKVGRLPAHHAGLFYVQEPRPVPLSRCWPPAWGEGAGFVRRSRGQVHPDCRAAGRGGPALVQRDRQKQGQVLLSNVERLGVANAWCPPAIPAAVRKPPGFFDKVLVDAPAPGRHVPPGLPPCPVEPESPAACASASGPF